MERVVLHKAVNWMPIGGGGLLTGMVTLGGEPVRAKIWDALTAASQDTASVAIVVAVIAIWCLLWYITKPKVVRDDGRTPGDHYEQNNEHGDNAMFFDRRK